MIKEIRDELLHKANKALREEAVQVSKSIRYPLKTSHVAFLTSHYYTSASLLPSATHQSHHLSTPDRPPLAVPILVTCHGGPPWASRPTWLHANNNMDFTPIVSGLTPSMLHAPVYRRRNNSALHLPSSTIPPSPPIPQHHPRR
jgi:hypothetical protein